MTMNKLSAIMLTWGGGQIVSFIFDGYVLGGANGMLNNMLHSGLGFNISSTNGFSVILMAINFVGNFLSKILFWNFSFLDGNMFIVKVFLTLIITVPALYGLWQSLRGS